jgi:hypothetical protein
MHGIQLFEANELSRGASSGGVGHKETLLKSFIPIYNISLRYQTANFQAPYRRLKESILRRTAFSFLTLLLGAKI